MKIKTIRFKKTTDFSPEQEREVKNMIIIISLFAAGMIIGAGIMRKGSSSELVADFSSIFDVFTQQRNSQKAYRIFFNSISVNMLFTVGVFFSGLSCIGLPVIVAIPIIKGIGYGMLSGYLFSVYAMNGIGYYLLIIFPSAVLGVSVLLLACCAAGIMSKELLGVILAKKQPESKILIAYMKRFAVYFAAIVLSSAVETVLTKAFGYLFTF